MGDFPATPETSLLLRSRLEGALREFSSIDCWATGLSLTDGGYIEVAYSKTRGLTDLQAAVVQAVEDLAYPVANLPAHTGKSPDRIASLRQHKYEYVGDSFRPHITLGRLAGAATHRFSIERFDSLSFTTPDIVVGHADDNGSITAIDMHLRRAS